MSEDNTIDFPQTSSTASGAASSSASAPRLTPQQASSLDAMLEESEPTEYCGLRLRPFTFGSLGLCRKMGLTMFSGGKQEGEEQPAGGAVADTEDELDDDAMFQLSAFFWMQSQPVKHVLNAVRKDTWVDEVEEFGFELPIHRMPELMAEVTRISNLAGAVAVDVEPKPGKASADEDAPGN